MKKIISIFIFLLLLVGCSLSNSPTSKVEELFSKYQRLDSDVRNGINDVVKDENLTDEQSTRYKKLLEKQYSNLSYDIKDEKIDGDNAVISSWPGPWTGFPLIPPGYPPAYPPAFLHPFHA